MKRALATLALLACACGARTAPLVEEDARIEGCEPSPEVCNGADDDCDAAVDEALALTHLSDPIVLRAPGETTTGDCPACDQALRADVAPLDGGGLVAYWQMNFAALEPQPNTFARRLDASGAPMEAAWRWSDRLTTLSLELAQLPDRRRVLTFCDRSREPGDRGDYPSLWLLDRDGRPAGEPVRVSESRCVEDGAQTATTDARLLIAVRHAPSEAELVVVGPDLHGESATELGLARGLAIGAAADGALVARSTEEGDPTRPDYAYGLRMHRLDPRGAPRGTSELVPLVGAHDLALLPRAEGYWLAMVEGEGAPELRALTSEGVPTGERRPLSAPSPGAFGDGIAVVSLPNGGAAAVVGLVRGGRDGRLEWSELHVLDAAGAITGTWSTLELDEPAWRAARLRVIGGRVAIVYTTAAPDEEHTDVRLRLLECTP